MPKKPTSKVPTKGKFTSGPSADDVIKEKKKAAGARVTARYSSKKKKK